MRTSAQRSARQCVVLGAAFLCAQAVVAASTEHVVAELFTSQGCSSCPPADAVAGRLRANPAVIVLSFHVNYWDGLGWRDPFSSQASTDRQYAYARSLSERSVFTPQLVLNGTQSLVGSQEGAIQHAITAASRVALPVQVSLTRQIDGHLALTLEGSAMDAELWEIEYAQHAVTQIRGGENSGGALETYNDVMHIRRLGAFYPGTFSLPALKAPPNGLAVLVQAPGMGRILGAGAYEIR
jgi:hypothetical protein